MITKLVTFLNLSVDIFSLHFFFPRTKLHIPPDICYLRMTDIESIMTIFGYCYNLLNNKVYYLQPELTSVDLCRLDAYLTNPISVTWILPY